MYLYCIMLESSSLVLPHGMGHVCACFAGSSPTLPFSRSASMASRAAGGWGQHMIKGLANTVSYFTGQQPGDWDTRYEPHCTLITPSRLLILLGIMYSMTCFYHNRRHERPDGVVPSLQPSVAAAHELAYKVVFHTTFVQG